MSGKEVIRAAQMFTKNGASKKVSALKEILIAIGLGTTTGLIWQVCIREVHRMCLYTDCIEGRGTLSWWCYIASETFRALLAWNSL